MVRRKGPPAVGETRKLTRAEWRISKLDSGMLVSINSDGKIIFSRVTRHGFGLTYTEKEMLRAARDLAEFWRDEHVIEKKHPRSTH